MLVHTVSDGVAEVVKTLETSLFIGFRNYTDAIIDLCEDLMARASDQARNTIIALPRVDTGMMRDSMVGDVNKVSDTHIQLILTGSVPNNPKSRNSAGAFVDYVSYQEFGADGIFGNPMLSIEPGLFMTSAMEDVYADLPSELNNLFERAFK